MSGAESPKQVDGTQPEASDDEEFAEFDEPVQAQLDDNSDGEFGSFDNGTIDNETMDKKPDVFAIFDDELMNNNTQFEAKLDMIMDQVFTIDSNISSSNSSAEKSLPIETLLNQRSQEVLNQLAAMPHLKPNNWIKLKIRHNLLIKLGIPINLDELTDDKTPTANSNKALLTHNRRRSINEDDISWQDFKIPDFKTLNMTTELKDELLSRTNEILSRIETDNLNNSSKSFLETAGDEKLKEKLRQFQNNYQQLIELSSVWKYHFNDLKNNFEIYESVVQNLIGYSQKLERDQLLQNLQQLKDKSKKRRSLWRR